MASKWITSGLIIIAAVATGAYFYVDHQSTQKVKANLDQLASEIAASGQGELDYQDPQLGLFSKKISVKDLSFKSTDPATPDIHIDKMVISNLSYDADKNIPIKMQIDLLNAKTVLKQVDKLFSDADALAAALFTEVIEVSDNSARISYDAQVGYELDPATATLDIHSKTHATEMMATTFNMSFANLPDINAPYIQAAIAGGMQQTEIEQQQMQDLMQALSKTALTQLTLSMKDEGMVAKLYQAALQDPELIAAMQTEGLKPSEYNLKLLLQQGLDQSLVNSERPVSDLQKQLVGHAKTFLASDSPYLEVTVKSVKPEGLSFTDALVLMMSNGHPDIVKSLMEVKVITH